MPVADRSLSYQIKPFIMKTIKSIFIALILLLSSLLNAQVSLNINFASPPQWGPSGYTDIRYYYLPDVEAYYDINTSMFIYLGNGVWLHSTQLPSRYSTYDLYYGYKVVMTDYRGDSPQIYFNDYKIKYKKGYRDKEQKTIGNKPGKGNANSGKQMNKQTAAPKQQQKSSSNANNGAPANKGNGGGKKPGHH
jgi:hypothetical protein